MLAPGWRHFRIGPYLRREPDKRQYHRLFHRGDAIGGLRRQLILCSYTRVPEEAVGRDVDHSRRAVVEFRTMEGMFEPLRTQHTLLARELRAIVRPSLLDVPPAVPFIAVHVRLGDFARSVDGPTAGHLNTRLPLDWYCEAVRAISSRMSGVPVHVFSDGGAQELRPLLELPRVSLRDTVSAVTDLLGMSRASALVASGSSFSMWASFLGQMPTLWFPGQRRQRLVEDVDARFEPEWQQGDPLPETFLDAVARKVRRGLDG